MAGVFEDQFTEVLVTSLKHTLIDDILHGPSILARGAEYIPWRALVPASWDLVPSSFSGLGGWGDTISSLDLWSGSACCS